MEIRAADFGLAFGRLCRCLQRHGRWTDPVTSSTTVGSAFGRRPRRTLECLGVQMRIEDPRRRVLPAVYREIDVRYAIAQFLWALNGTGDHDAILHYNTKGRDFLGPDGRFACAIPDRLDGDEPSSSPLRAAIAILRRDPSSRRSYVPFVYSRDLLEEPRDFPCMAGIHFLLRDGRLHAVTHMRSQSLIGVLPYDLFLTTMLQELVAVELGVRLGHYVHQMSSVHVYDDELPKLRRALSVEPASAPAMAPMLLSPLQCEGLFAFEAAVRRQDASQFPTWLSVESLGALDDYWQRICRVLLGEFANSALAAG